MRRRIQCVSMLSPMAALNASFTTSALVFVLRILCLKSVGCSVLGPRSGPTLSGPCPVGVTRPCLSVSVVFHPCLSVKVCACCRCNRDCSQAASEVPRLWRVDAVLRMAWLARYSSFGSRCLVAVHWARAWTCDSTVPGQWGQSAVMSEPSACVSFRRFLSCLVGNLFRMIFVRKIRR